MEIGTEELPAAYLPGLIEQLRASAEARMRSEHLAFARIESFGTPRRLVLIVRGLSSVQRAPAEEIRGPSQQVCYDAAGQPTKALLGFLKSRGGALTDITLVPSQKGAYVYLTKPPSVTPTARVLAGLPAALVDGLRAPKTMRWDASGLRFARPIRWMMALYGSKPITCSLGSLTSRPRTWIGGPLRPRRVAVTSGEHYLRTLKGAGILLDHRVRRERVARDVAVLARRSGGRPVEETLVHGLLDEVTHLVERPVPLGGAFDPAYLALPREVLLASMAKHQRVFAIEDKAGTLLPRFVAILDGAPTQPAAVRKTMERILNARLADSLVFWEADRRQSLDALAEQGAGITFHERLGSMQDKTARLVAAAGPLAALWKLSAEESRELERACRFAKADLASTMVREFPTLQGVMGKHYALAAGEPRAVAQAIEEHYLPLGGRKPESLLGRALAILEKYDTLACNFAIGIEPTGDQDPFGLRRAAQGIVEVAWAARRALEFDTLRRVYTSHGWFPTAKHDMGTACDRVKRYVLERLATFDWPSPRPSTAWIDAVLASAGDDLVETMERIAALSRLDGTPSLLKAAKIIERTRNILKGAASAPGQVEPAGLVEPSERRLWERYQAQAGRIRELIGARAYAEATTLFGDTLFEPLHEFFDQVLVNAPEEPLRRNRLALMKTIHTLYTEALADLSKLNLTVQPVKEESR